MPLRARTNDDNAVFVFLKANETVFNRSEFVGNTDLNACDAIVFTAAAIEIGNLSIFKVRPGDHTVQGRPFGQLVFISKRVFFYVLAAVPFAGMIDVHVTERGIDPACAQLVNQTQNPVIL